uniref:Metallophos domain-containing protein n=1 Tax=Macrostomum lignano TaxID=282301 RepID=A0A1I8FA75_9PLAT
VQWVSPVGEGHQQWKSKLVRDKKFESVQFVKAEVDQSKAKSDAESSYFCWLPTDVYRALDGVASMPVRSGDIFVVSFPKAGTTWLQELVFMLATDFDSKLAETVSIEDRFPYLEYPYRDSPLLSVIYLARCPKDTSISYYHFLRMLSPLIGYTGDWSGDFVDRFLDSSGDRPLPYGPWLDHVEAFWRVSCDRPDRVMFLTYEELMADTAAACNGILSGCRAGGWRSLMSADEAARFDAELLEPLRAGCGLRLGETGEKRARQPLDIRSCSWPIILAVYNVAAWLLFGSQYPWRALSARANVLFVSELGELLAIWLLWRWVHPGRDIWERIVGILMTPVYLGTVLALPAGLLLSGGAQVNPLVLACYICGGQCLQFTFYALLAHCLSMCYRFLIGTRLGPMLNKGFFCAALPLAVSVAMTTAGLSGVSSSALSAGRGIPVRRIDIELPRLPSSMRGLQVALVSDLHIGPTLNGLKPDVVALVGDLADTPGTQFLSAAAPLANVQAKLAKVYVTGNHEYLTMRPQAWIRA